MDPALFFAGVVATTFIQWFKTYFATNSSGTLIVVAVVSFIGACIYVALDWFGFWQAFLGILTIAAAIYALLIQRFE